MQVPRAPRNGGAHGGASGCIQQDIPEANQGGDAGGRTVGAVEEVKALMNNTTKIQVTAASRRPSNGLRPHGVCATRRPA